MASTLSTESKSSKPTSCQCHPEYATSVLAFKLDDLHLPKHLYSAIEHVVRCTSTRVLVLVFCALFDDEVGLSHTAHWEQVQALLTAVYAWSARVGQEQEKVTLQVDVLLKGSSVSFFPDGEWDHLFLADIASGAVYVEFFDNGSL